MRTKMLMIVETSHLLYKLCEYDESEHQSRPFDYDPIWTWQTGPDLGAVSTDAGANP